MAGRTIPPAEELPGLSMVNLIELVDAWGDEAGTGYAMEGKDLLYELLRRIGVLRARADETDPTAPDVRDLTVELREAVGLFAGALPMSPKAAWDEAVAVARRAVQERDELEHAARATPCDRRLASRSVYELRTALVLNLTVADVGAVLELLGEHGYRVEVGLSRDGGR